MGCWIGTVNKALEDSALATLVAFIAMDIGSALCLLAAIMGLGVQVNAGFALACKAPCCLFYFVGCKCTMAVEVCASMWRGY